MASAQRRRIEAAAPVEQQAAVAETPEAGFDLRLFDADYYRQQNPDVAGQGIDPLEHFLKSGWREGRNPSAWFSIRFYLRSYDDVAQIGINPVEHYAQYGWREGRDPSEAFSIGKYTNAYRDVREAGIDPLLHFMVYGRFDGRIAFHV